MDICECDCKLDQDENAARNILAIALKEVGCALLKLLDVSSKNASGDIDLYRVGSRAKNHLLIIGYHDPTNYMKTQGAWEKLIR